jgi:hypothetical protein
MSRLDDELRNAFRREPPPPDFTVRLLERIAQQPAPRPRWWQRLAMLVEPPKLRWVAIGVTASLLLAIGAAQYSKYSRLHQAPVNDNGQIAGTLPAPEDGIKRTEPAAAAPGSDRAQHQAQHQAQPGAASPGHVSKRPRSAGSSSTNRRLAVARDQRERERELRIEGEAAKEKLMLALSIASATLNEAQKAIHDDGPKP